MFIKGNNYSPQLKDGDWNVVGIFHGYCSDWFVLLIFRYFCLFIIIEEFTFIEVSGIKRILQHIQTSQWFCTTCSFMLRALSLFTSRVCRRGNVFVVSVRLPVCLSVWDLTSEEVDTETSFLYGGTS